MLTSTYTLVALSVEQARARVEVEALMERWRPKAWWGEGPHQWTLRQFEQACEALRRVYESCHWRKLDKFVLPALRRAAAGAAAESLLVRLEGLFPLARSLISGETWFAIANQMLAHDTHQVEARAAAPGLSAGAEYSARKGPALPLVH